MSSRKDLVNRIRKDIGAPAALALAGTGLPASRRAIEPEPEQVATIGVAAQFPLSPKHDDALETVSQDEDSREVTAVDARRRAAIPQEQAQSKRSGRGVAVYIALSLTEEQAHRAEAWAAVAGCSIGFLIRRVAQSARKEIVVDWSAGRIETAPSLRQVQGFASTSVTLTLPAALAQTLQSRFDPFGLLGLGRAIGPAFRARFDATFDHACTRAGF